MVAFCSLKIERGIEPNVKNENGKMSIIIDTWLILKGPHSNPKIFS